MTSTTTKAAKNLTPGDVIQVPQQDRKWLKGPLTVVSVSEGKIDARGVWLVVRATFLSPYADKISENVWCFRPETPVRLVVATN